MVLAAALVLGVASAAQAGSRDDADSSGGYSLGPAVQSFGGGVNPAFHSSLSGSSANAYVEPRQQGRSHKKTSDH
jgi:hypothetical protein